MKLHKLPEALITSHGSAYSPSEVSPQNDQLNDDHWTKKVGQAHIQCIIRQILKVAHLKIIYRKPPTFCNHNLTKHKTENAHSLAAKVFHVKLAQEPAVKEG